MKKFIYVFTVGGKIEHSEESAERVLSRLDEYQEIRQDVERFLDNAKAGDYHILGIPVGLSKQYMVKEMIFCVENDDNFILQPPKTKNKQELSEHYHLSP